MKANVKSKNTTNTVTVTVTPHCVQNFWFSLCRGVGWGVEGSRLEAWMKSQVRGCYNITFICTTTNQETVSVLEKTQANVTFRT